MDYYHDLVTQKSWQELTLLVKTIPFVLIGGWAVYLYTNTLKSKDIDIIIDYETLSKIKQLYDTYKNDRLNKYEAIKGEIQIDIYLPHYSKLGLPIETIIDKTKLIDGFTVINPNYLFILKLYTLGERGRTPKGKKDFLDLISLLQTNIIDLNQINLILINNKLHQCKENFTAFLQEYTQIPELGLTTHQYSKLRKKVISIL